MGGGSGMTNLPRPGRRHLLAMAATLPVAARAGRLLAAPPPAPAAPFTDSPKLLVAGPPDGALNRWADALQPALQASLPPDTAIRRVEVGSTDGVTGANQFEVRGVPDGATILLVPGQAALAWMVGDPRAQFDVGHWVPVMSGMASGIVVGRSDALANRGRVRVAAASPASVDLAALIGLQLLGVPIQPVFGVMDVGAAQTAFASGAVDAVFLHGPRISDQVAALAASGAQPWYALGVPADSGKRARDPLFPNVPHFAELYETRSGRAPSGPLYDAWCAVVAAAQLDFSLVLQQLTPAAMVALWRRAGADAVAALPVQVVSNDLGVRLMAAPDVTTNTAATAATAATLTELRGWLASQFNWRPA
jgi:hypothetical protein